MTIYGVSNEHSNESEVGYLQCDYIQQAHVYLNGLIYWLACRYVNGSYVANWISIFNIVEMVYKEIVIPEVNEDWRTMIIEYDGKIDIL